YQGQISAQLPFGIQGPFKLFIAVDAANAVLEADETNNVSSFPISISRQRPPNDLVVAAITSPAAALTGQAISLTWQVVNQGTATTTSGDWSDRVYVSADDQFAHAVPVGTFEHSGTVAAGQ